MKMISISQNYQLGFSMINYYSTCFKKLHVIAKKEKVTHICVICERGSFRNDFSVSVSKVSKYSTATLGMLDLYLIYFFYLTKHERIC